MAAERIVMSGEQVKNREYEQFSPVTNEFIWNEDFTEVTIVPLTWWDNASYAAYQGDPEARFE